MFTLSPATVATITGLLLPLLVGIIVKADASPRLKVATNIAASALAAALLNAANEAGYAVLTWDWLALFAQQTATAIATYLGVLKPLGVHPLPQFGLGTIPADTAPPPSTTTAAPATARNQPRRRIN